MLLKDVNDLRIIMISLSFRIRIVNNLFIYVVFEKFYRKLYIFPHLRRSKFGQNVVIQRVSADGKQTVRSDFLKLLPGNLCIVRRMVTSRFLLCLINEFNYYPVLSCLELFLTEGLYRLKSLYSLGRCGEIEMAQRVQFDANPVFGVSLPANSFTFFRFILLDPPRALITANTFYVSMFLPC